MRYPDRYTATLTFLAPGDGPPAYYASQAGEEARLELDGAYETHSVSIDNGRLAGTDFSLDREGFRLVEEPSAVDDFYDDAEIEGVYSAEVERLVKEATGAARTCCFDHTRRADSRSVRGERKTREPSTVVHNDYTDKSGPQRVRDMMGAEAEELLSRRFAIVNVWRPIRHPADTSMLALCTADSVAPEHLIPTPRVAKDRIGELMLAHYDTAQEWVSFPAMTPGEALLLKTYDSSTDGRARFAIHTAFDNPDPPADARPRESIESRVFAFFAD